MRRILFVLSIMATPWLAFFLSGHGIMVARQVSTSVAVEGAATCHYLHATGMFELTEFTPTPHAVECPRFFPVRWPASRPELSSDGHWAAAIPGDRPVTVECRFVQRPTDGSGLAHQFTADAPLRLTLDLRAGAVDVAADDVRAALGAGTPMMPGTISSNIVWLTYQHGAMPVFGAPNNGRLTLSIDPSNGRATLIFSAATPRLLWVRDGGCRPVQARA